MAIQDPVCNMTIEEKDAVGTSTYEGHTYHFCSEGTSKLETSYQTVQF